MLSIITPTRFRPASFAKVEECVRNTEYAGPLEWIVACSGNPKDYCFTCNQQVIVRAYEPDSKMHDMNANLLAAMEMVTGDRVVVLEDDDHTSPFYLTRMVEMLDEFPLVGLAPAMYYHLSSSTWDCVSLGYAPLGATGFTSEVFETFRQGLNLGSPGVDAWLWTHWALALGQPCMLAWNSLDVIGLKDGAGIWVGHQELRYRDEDGSVLRTWLRECPLPPY